MRDGQASRRIVVVSGSRADYGLLKSTMSLLAAQPGVDLKVVLTGMHLSDSFGQTSQTVEADGFAIVARVPIPLSGDGQQDIARATGLAAVGFADVLQDLAPDLVLVLGDRYEILAASTSAMLLGIPLAHIHGGEVTEGAFDDSIRHAISKMAHLHFAAAEPYRQRLIRMGEHPDRVFNTGAPGLDLAQSQQAASRQDVLAWLGLEGASRYFLATLHPETMHLAANEPMVQAMLAALDAFPQHGVVFTGVNADPGNHAIDAAIRAFVASRPGRTRWSVSLGSERYWQAMRYADALVGNSSSGIIEAPALGVPTVNIGDRQKGRLRAASIIDCPAGFSDIVASLDKALSPEFRASLRLSEPPYGRGGASAGIAEILAQYDIAALGPKGFWDPPGD